MLKGCLRVPAAQDSRKQSVQIRGGERTEKQ